MAVCQNTINNNRVTSVYMITLCPLKNNDDVTNHVIIYSNNIIITNRVFIKIKVQFSSVTECYKSYSCLIWTNIQTLISTVTRDNGMDKINLLHPMIIWRAIHCNTIPGQSYSLLKDKCK